MIFDLALYWDLRIFNWVNSGASNIICDKIMPGITYLGDFWAGWIFIIILIMINREAILSGLRLGLFSSLIYGCTSGAHSAIRYLVDRPRPFIDHEVIVRLPYLAHSPPTDPSLPSGHTVIAFMIATIASCEIKNIGKYKFILYGVACLVGFSRIYLGVHYPSDVVVGALLGYGVTKLILSSKSIRSEILKIRRRIRTSFNRKKLEGGR
jgi:undecaprenyl-diphosphatase